MSLLDLSNSILEKQKQERQAKIEEREQAWVTLAEVLLRSSTSRGDKELVTQLMDTLELGPDEMRQIISTVRHALATYDRVINLNKEALYEKVRLLEEERESTLEEFKAKQAMLNQQITEAQHEARGPRDAAIALRKICREHPWLFSDPTDSLSLRLPE